MNAFDSPSGQDYIKLVPEYLRIISNELKRANDLKEYELKTTQKNNIESIEGEEE